MQCKKTAVTAKELYEFCRLFSFATLNKNTAHLKLFGYRQYGEKAIPKKGRFSYRNGIPGGGKTNHRARGVTRIIR